jgi:EAL domain-containing protein (putative c-di-GMP-specific phosphodiesterase class I)
VSEPEAETEDPLIILVVEDDETTRRALTRMLAMDSRVEVLDAADGLDALAILEDQPVDLVISDEVMPTINGIRLLETIKHRWPGTRRVLYTGYADARTVMDAINRGGVDKALSKAISAEELRTELLELIDDCLAKRIDSGQLLSGRPSRSMPMVAAEGPRPVLVIGDELAVRKTIEEALHAEGFDVRAAGSEAIVASMQRAPSDVVVLDLSGDTSDPKANLMSIRSVDLDCPVIVLVSRGHVQRAHAAIHFGAHRHLVHPVDRKALSEIVKRAATLNRLSRARRDAVAATGGIGGSGLGGRAALEFQFQSALEKLYMVYQPIVTWGDKRILGYEALVRSEESAMPHPGLLLNAADRLDRMEDLSQAIRRIVAEPFVRRTDDLRLFLNLHVSDVASPDLLKSSLVEMAAHIVLEITERATLDSVPDFASHVSALRARGYSIAIDDLGAGYAGLSSFATLDPDIVKLDMSLVRGVHTSPTKRRLVKSLQDACADLGVPMVAEGVETTEERDALVAAGCDIFQGYLFGRPLRTLEEPNWA